MDEAKTEQSKAVEGRSECARPVEERSRRLLRCVGLGTLIGVHLWLASASVLVLLETLDEVPDALGIVVGTLLLAQGSLLGIGIAVAGRATPWLLAIMTAALVGSARLLQWASQDPFVDLEKLVFLHLVQMLATFVPLFPLLKVTRLRVVPMARDGSIPLGGRFQFSIRTLLVWTTAVAVVLGTIRLLPGDLTVTVESVDDALTWLLALGIDCVVSMAALWGTLGRRWLVGRLCALGVTCTAAVALFIMLPNGAELWQALLLTGSYAFWLIGSLAFVRLVGYRLVWREWPKPGEVDGLP